MRQLFMGILSLGVSFLGLDSFAPAHGASKSEIDYRERRVYHRRSIW